MVGTTADRGAAIRRPACSASTPCGRSRPTTCGRAASSCCTSTAPRSRRSRRRRPASSADFLGFAANDLYAVAGASLLHWDGAAWSAVDFGGTIDPSGLTAIWGTSASDLWLGDSSNGRVHRWNGTTWSTTVTQVVEVTDIWGSSSSDVYVSGIFGLSHWNGATWTESDDFLVDHSDGLWGSGPERRLGGERDRRARALGRRRVDRHAAARQRSLPGGPQQGMGQRAQRRLGRGQLRRAVALERLGLDQTQYGKFPYFPYLNAVHGSAPDNVWAVGFTSDGSNANVILHLEQ